MSLSEHSRRVIVVGASTGGTEALRVFLSQLPRQAPPILIAQHMPEAFTASFASRLDGVCKIRVKEAEHGETLVDGQAYIAPGHSHLLVSSAGASYRTALSKAAPVNRHRPSVEMLFKSAAVILGANAIGVMLTGMGRDGALAMLEMRRANAYNLAQDEASCVVFGMPHAAIEAGAVHEIVPLEKMAERVMMQVRC